MTRKLGVVITTQISRNSSFTSAFLLLLALLPRAPLLLLLLVTAADVPTPWSKHGSKGSSSSIVSKVYSGPSRAAGCSGVGRHDL